MFTKINRASQQDQSSSTPCTMEPMEARLMMAVDYFVPMPGFDKLANTIGDDAQLTTTVAGPTTGILIGLLLPAVQKMRG